MKQEADLKVVGQRTPKRDGLEIVTGRAVYAADIQLPGMLYGRILHSPHAHARIRRIDTSRARALAGVVDVVTGADVPRLDTLFAVDEVCYEGHKVAAVAAEDPDIAVDALSLIEVEYEVLPAVTDPLAAMDPESPIARFGVPPGEVRDREGRLLPNVGGQHEIVEGDVARGFAEADAVVEAEYRVPFFHQGYLEPNAATARVEADGRITIWTAAQGSFAIRDRVAGPLRVPHHRIRVIVTQVGGGFGAKNGIFVEPHAAVLAQRTGRPVRVDMTREEEFVDGAPASGCVARLRSGARKDGTLTALEGWIVWDGGWVGGGGGAHRLRMLYHVPNVRLEGFGVRTNKLSPGAYRAPGAPPTAFVRESQMDLLARKLGMDPLEFRLKNAVRQEDPSPSDKPQPKDLFAMTLKKAAEKARWGKKRLRRNQGMGVACGEWTNAGSQSNAFIALHEDGSVSVLTGQVDITGLHTVLAQIAAEELGVPVEKVTVTLGDSDMVPYTCLSAGSQATYVAGTATRRAAQEARTRILRAAAQFLEVSEDRLELSRGRVQVTGKPDHSVGLAELAATAIHSEEGPISGSCVVGRIPTWPSYSVDVVTVEVDPETGKVELLDVVAVQDVGRALNPMLVEGQMHGGVVQSLGLGMMEGYRYDEQSRLMNPNLVDYPLPTAVDIPSIQTALVEEPCADGPYGAKGVGEPPIIPGAAALANAVHDATGVRVTEVPITPERVLAALRRPSESAD